MQSRPRRMRSRKSLFEERERERERGGGETPGLPTYTPTVAAREKPTGLNIPRKSEESEENGVKNGIESAKNILPLLLCVCVCVSGWNVWSTLLLGGARLDIYARDKRFFIVRKVEKCVCELYSLLSSGIYWNCALTKRDLYKS